MASVSLMRGMGGVALGKDEASNNLPLNGFQEGIIRCLDRDGSHGMQCARSAVRNLMKAWNLRDLDLGMALFRCLTAEEEAATAVFLALKSRQYEGASRLLISNKAPQAMDAAAPTA